MGSKHHLSIYIYYAISMYPCHKLVKMKIRYLKALPTSTEAIKSEIRLEMATLQGSTSSRCLPWNFLTVDTSFMLR